MNANTVSLTALGPSYYLQYLATIQNSVLDIAIS